MEELIKRGQVLRHRAYFWTWRHRSGRRPPFRGCSNLRQLHGLGLVKSVRAQVHVAHVAWTEEGHDDGRIVRHTGRLLPQFDFALMINAFNTRKHNEVLMVRSFEDYPRVFRKQARSGSPKNDPTLRHLAEPSRGQTFTMPARNSNWAPAS